MEKNTEDRHESLESSEYIPIWRPLKHYTYEIIDSCKKLKFRCHNIDWETDGDPVVLPKEMIVEIDDPDIIEKFYHVNYAIVNALGDTGDWLVYDFEWEPIR